MKKFFIFFEVFCAFLIFSACSLQAEKDEEIERLRAENESLRAETTTTYTIETTTAETTIITSATTVTTTAIKSTNDLVNEFTEYLQIYYDDVEISYNNETDIFTATCTVRDSNTIMTTDIELLWTHFVDSSYERFYNVRKMILSNGYESTFDLNLISDSDNSNILCYSKKRISYNSREDVFDYKPKYRMVTTDTVDANISTNTSTPTKGEENALKKAKEYLNYSSFSRSGLISQLEYEKFSTSEATYAVDNCGADWNEQAALKAAEYLEFMAFSEDGLIDQLEYEGFSHSQAVYGVGKAYK